MTPMHKPTAFIVQGAGTSSVKCPRMGCDWSAVHPSEQEASHRFLVHFDSTHVEPADED